MSFPTLLLGSLSLCISGEKSALIILLGALYFNTPISAELSFLGICFCVFFVFVMHRR